MIQPASPARGLLSVLLCVAAFCASAGAQEPPAPAAPAGAPSAGRRVQMPGNIRIHAGEQVGDEQSNEIRFSGYVDIEAGDARIQADQVIYRRAEGTVEATGNVVLSFTGAVLAGTRLFYELGPQTGQIEDVVGYLDQDNAILRAKRVERLGPETLRVEDAVFTTCSQPTPYWSFKLGSGTFHLGQYAYLHNVSFNARKVPVFWSPYLVWPIKSGRAAGLLFPEFRNSTKLGTSVGVPYYWPFRDNADLTFTLTGYTKVGLGLNTHLDWLPTWLGWARGDLSYINDQVRGKSRYLLLWQQSQRFENDFQLTATLEQVSDFDYFTDYETNLIRAATPQTNSVVDLSRAWSWYSLSFRARRYEQFFVGSTGDQTLLSGKVINNTLPQVEFRGRSQRIGTSPVFVSFESSVTGFSRDILGPPAGSSGVVQETELVSQHRSNWGRFDASPQFQVPLVKGPWGDLTINGGWRGTFYTARTSADDPQSVTSTSLFRSLWNAGFTFSGPRFQRIFLTPDWGFTPKLKHVIEPFVTYQWRPRSGVDPNDVPVFDEIDVVPGEFSDVTYGIRQRFIALRKPEAGRASGLASAKETSFEGLERQSKEQEQATAKSQAQTSTEDKLDVDQGYGPVEVASVEITQQRSLVRSLSQSYILDPVTGAVAVDPVTQAPLVVSRFYSPVSMRLRFNPTAEQVIDASVSYSPANKRVTEMSLSAIYRLSESTYSSGSWFRRLPEANGLADATNFFRARWGVVTPGRRFSLETEWDLNLVNHKLEHQAYAARWSTQCCSFRFGYDQRSFLDNAQREFSLVVDLFGIGEVIKFQGAR